MGIDSQITQKIISSIIKGNTNVSDIRVDTGLHRKTLSKHLTLLAKLELVEQENKGWRRGQSMLFSVTAKGTNWLVNNPLGDTLKLITDMAVELANPKFQKFFNKIKDEHNAENTKIINDYFIDRTLSGDKSFNPPETDQKDFDEPFRLALKKILMLHLYLMKNNTQTPEEIESWIEKDSVLFWPDMRFAFSVRKDAFPKFEQALYEVDQSLRKQSYELQNQGSRITHLMGLDFVDEIYFEKYLKASSLSERRKAMREIEIKVGWDVKVLTAKLFKEMRNEVDKYLDKNMRPNLYQFIKRFTDQKRISKYPKAHQ